jgi:2-hydroxy-3-keto-5-methylthiopentenyl-1-phosphate phosphatase
VGQWWKLFVEVYWHSEHSSIFGHDKSLEIKHCVALPDGERPVVAFAGDGVSDLSAASETNILFAKEGLGK